MNGIGFWHIIYPLAILATTGAIIMLINDIRQGRF